jgi:hypothetical protein
MQERKKSKPPPCRKERDNDGAPLNYQNKFIGALYLLEITKSTVLAGFTVTGFSQVFG